MNQDGAMNQILFAALQAGVGKVPGITSANGSVAIRFNREVLACSAASCSLSWDPGATNDSASFQGALFDTLYLYSKSTGQGNPHLQVNTYGLNIQIKITQDKSDDEVSCDLFHAATIYKQCSITTSEAVRPNGTNAQELEMLFAGFSNPQGGLNSVVQTVVDLTKSTRFLPPSSTESANGAIEVIHTIHTDMVIDGYAVSRRYAYADNESTGGNGIVLTLTGSLMESGQYITEKLTVGTYAIPRPLQNGPKE